MKKQTLLAIARIVSLGAPALADLNLRIHLSYRTGPYAANGIPFADGYADYFTLIERTRWWNWR